jgi:hypothetical protein
VLAAEVIGATAGQVVVGSAVPGSAGAVEQFVPVQSGTAGAVLWCDGRRMVELPPGARVEVRRGSLPVLLARLPAAAGAASATGPRATAPGPEVRTGAPFTDRLVAKFGLPVAGWRGQPADRAEAMDAGEDALARDDAAEMTNEEPGGHA